MRHIIVLTLQDGREVAYAREADNEYDALDSLTYTKYVSKIRISASGDTLREVRKIEHWAIEGVDF